MILPLVQSGEAWDWKEWTLFGELCLIFLVGIPMIAWALYSLVKDWHEVHVVKRSRYFMLALIIHAAVFQFTYMPLLIARFLWDTQSGTFGVINYFAATIYSDWTGFITLWVLVARYWLYYFHLRLIKYNSVKNWFMAIDPIHHVSNWFVANINKYGSQNYLLKLIIFITTIQSLSILVLKVLYSPYTSIIDNNDNIPVGMQWFQYFVVYFIQLYFFIKLRVQNPHSSFTDNLGIYNELTVVTVVFALMLILEFGLIILVHVVDNELFWVFFLYSWFPFSILHTYLFALYPKRSFLALYKQRQTATSGMTRPRRRSSQTSRSFKIRVGSRLRADTTDTVQSTKSSSGSVSGGDADIHGIVSVSGASSQLELSVVREERSQQSTKKNIAQPTSPKHSIHWSQIAQSYDGMEALMSFVESEFSMELLLFQLEYVQTKNVLKHVFSEIMDQIHKESSQRGEIKLPESSGSDRRRIPKSLIATELANTLRHLTTSFAPDAQLQVGASEDIIELCDEIINSFRKLYNKYIDPARAAFMINVSSQNRSQVVHMFDCDHLKRLRRDSNTTQSQLQLGRLSQMSQMSQMSQRSQRSQLSQASLASVSVYEAAALQGVANISNIGSAHASNSAKVASTSNSIGATVLPLETPPIQLSQVSGSAGSVRSVRSVSGMSVVSNVSAEVSGVSGVSEKSKNVDLNEIVIMRQDESVINQEVREFVIVTNGVRNKDVVHFVLCKVFNCMEPCATEVSRLMQFSFNRFRLKHEELVEKLLSQVAS